MKVYSFKDMTLINTVLLLLVFKTVQVRKIHIFFSLNLMTNIVTLVNYSANSNMYCDFS